MAVPAASIITRALYQSQTQNYTQFALYELNDVLDHIARTIDFAAAQAQYNFFFSTNLVTSGAGNIIQSAQQPMPMDYLRVQTSGGSTGAQRSTKWYLQGVPYDMIEVDLTEFDDQVQQAGIQSYPYFCAKVMANYSPMIEVTGDISSASQTVSNLAIADTSILGNQTYTGASLNLITAGMAVSGGIGPQSFIVPGTTVTATSGGPPPTSLTLSEAPASPTGLAFSMTGATLLIGYAPALLIYPPPSGGFACMIRYQRQMPRLTQAQVDAGAYCWFPDDIVLIEGLAGNMMKYSGDTGQNEFIGSGMGSGEGRYGKMLGQYLKQADDTSNRAKTVQLDRRTFGHSFKTLRNTKQVGW